MEKGLFLTISLLAVLLVGSMVLAAEPGVMYDCAFPVTVTLDGDFADWPGVPWDTVDHTMGWNNPDSDADGSMKFACVADDQFLYVGVKIWDDAKVIDENVGGDVWQDDSVEIYIDGGDEKASTYDANDAQITIGRDNVGGDVLHPKLGGSGPKDNTQAAVIETDYGWAIESAILLSDFGIAPADGTVIGFNIQLNDDDDKGGRDHKLAWSAVELAKGESSWNNPSVFAELEFVSSTTPVSAMDKVATTWASIKE